MGCWHGTCGLTHLPITAGTKVRGFILEKHDYNELSERLTGAGPTYSSDLFHPISWPIKGKYDDYGSMEDIVVDDNAKALLTYINAKLTNGQLVSSEGIKTYKTVEEMIKDIAQGATSLGFMMVIESVYAASIKGYETTLYGDYDANRRKENIIEDLNQAKKYLIEVESPRRLKNTLSKLGNKSAKLVVDSKILNMALGIYDFPKRKGAHHNAAESFIGFRSRNESVVSGEFSINHMKSLLMSPSKVNINDAANHFIFCCIMSDARRTWIPQCGQGSQTDNYRLHRIIAEATVAVVNDKKREHSEDVDLTDPAELEYSKHLY